MEIIFKVLWLDEISWEEGRTGERRASTKLAPLPLQHGEGDSRKGGLPEPGEQPGEQRFRREGALAASCCREIKSDDHRETTGAFGSLAVGDTGCGNPGPRSSACSRSQRRW